MIIMNEVDKQKLENLEEQWREQAETYPDHTSGQAAASAVRLCADELKDVVEDIVAGEDDSEEGEIDEADSVMYYIESFMRDKEIGPEFNPTVESVQAQYGVFEEEVEEFEDEYVGWIKNMVQGVNGNGLGTVNRRAMMAEELADVRITVDLLAKMLQIDIEEAERAKMMYNLTKSGDTDESGKVTDDSGATKPDFEEVVEE